MESACELVLYRCYQEVWKRGEEYVKTGAAQLDKWNDKQAVATVQGRGTYLTRLAFRGGGLSRHCNCPFKGDFCKHMVAVAILWDQKRGLPPLSAEEIEAEAIPPPLVTRHDIDRMYRDPLHADLNIMRIAADEMGSRHRSHKVLPTSPKINDDPAVPLEISEIDQAARQFDQWSRARNYDPYFCAGEMMAAFCALTRTVIQRVRASNSESAAKVWLRLEKLHKEVVLEMIDDSDGLHLFGSVHLKKLYDQVNARNDITDAAKEVLGTFTALHDNW